MSTTYINVVSSASQLSADIKAIDLASKADGGKGTNYVITLAAGKTLTESADISAINLAGNDTLTINGQGAVLDGAGAYRGLFAYAGKTKIENLTIEDAVANGGGGGAGLGGGLFVANNSQVTLDNVFFSGDSAVGGAGGGGLAGGGGGLGGAGGFGGGGVGSSGFGGSGSSAGGAGLIPGAAGGGSGLNGGGGGASGGGGGAGFSAGAGGGGGVGGGATLERIGGAGGFGGGGGGGHGVRPPTSPDVSFQGVGGRGGFGGGGGGAGPYVAGGGGFGGFGGFGGGGGGGNLRRGGGGFGAGNGATGGGGGGLGAGGDIFVMAGASLTIEGGNLGAGTVTGGLGASGAGNGDAFGGGLFLQGDESITLAPAAGTVDTISGVVADQTGSGGKRANAGAGRLVLDGSGTLDLTAANTFTGGIGIREGTLELANAAAAGSGRIHFASTSSELESGAGAHLANTISGFGGADAIDFAKVKYAAGDTAVDNSGNVSIETSADSTVATFNVIGAYTSASFDVGADTSGDVLVTYAATAANAADLLGRYDPAFAEPPSTPISDALAFDAWTALGSSAGHSGGFDFHHDGNAGGARDIWGVGGSDCQIGHGPGPG